MSLVSDTPSTDTPSRRRFGLAPAAAAVFGASMGGTAIRFGVQVLLIRWLGAASYGSFVVARGWGELLGKLPDRGFALGSVRFIPRYMAGEDHGRHRGLLIRSIRGTVVASLVIVLLACLIALVLGEGTSTLVGLSLAIVIALAGILRAALQGSHAYMPATVLMELGQPTIMAAGLGLLWWADRLSVVTALGAVFVGWSVVSLLEGQMLRRRTPAQVFTTDAIYEDSAWKSSTRHLFAAQIGIGVINVSDVLIVGATVGTTEAGIYAIATRIAAIGRIANAAVESLVSPQIAAAADSGEAGRPVIQRVIDRAIRLSIGPSALFAIAAIVAATPVLELIGKDFSGGRTVLILLVLSNLADAVSGPSGHVVSLAGSERTYARIMSAHAVGLVLFAIPFGLVGGMVGVAVVRTLVNVSWNATLFAVARRHLGVWCFFRFRAAA